MENADTGKILEKVVAMRPSEGKSQLLQAAVDAKRYGCIPRELDHWITSLRKTGLAHPAKERCDP